MDFSDEQLDYIRKNLNQPVQIIGNKLNLKVEQVNQAIEGLTGVKSINKYASKYFWMHTVIYIYISFFLIYATYLNQDFIEGRMILIGPVLLVGFSLFFIKSIIIKSVTIKNSPIDLPVYLFAFTFFTYSIFNPIKQISLFNLNIGVYIGIIYFLLSNTSKEFFFSKLLKFVAWLILALSIVDFNSAKYLIPFILPILICFAIYSQKKKTMYLYSATIPFLYLKCIYSNDIIFLIITFTITTIYIATIYVIKNKTNGIIAKSPSFKNGIFLAIICSVFYSIVQNFICPINDISFNSGALIGMLANFNFLKPVLGLISFKNPVNLDAYLNASSIMIYPMVIFLITLFFLGLKSIKQSDCFSEKIFAGINLSISAYLICILFLETKLPLFLFLFMCSLLAYSIGSQTFFISRQDGKDIKTRKEVILMKYPAFTFGLIMLISTIWMVVDGVKSIN